MDYETIKKKSNTDKIVISIKISIIVLVSVYLIGNFEPYFEGSDAYVYGITAIDLSNGKFELTNKLLQETGRWEFVPSPWTKTIYDTAVPITSIGFPVISSLFYSIGGLYGLFYVGPIFTIIFFITSERVATKLFNNYVGLITLLLLATNSLIFEYGKALLSEGIFSTVLVLGIYFLIKFFRYKNNKYVMLASIFLAIGTLFRIVGLFFLPFEIFFIGTFFIYQFYKQKKHKSKKVINKIFKKNTWKLVLCIVIPWLIFFAFWFSYNNYYFGDPFINYDNVPKPFEKEFGRGSMENILYFDENRFENIKGYSKFFLPYSVFAVEYLPNSQDFLGKNDLGIITIVLLISAVSISLLKYKKRVEMIVFATAISSSVLLYSSSYFTFLDFIVGRYMIPLYSINAMMLGFLIMQINTVIIKKSLSYKFLQHIRIILIIIFILFFLVSFYISIPIKTWIDEGFKIKNPNDVTKIYPLDLEGLTEKSIILNAENSWVVDYDVIPFNPFLGYSFKTEFNNKLMNQESINLLKKVIDDGYDVYVFKKSSHKIEKPFLNELVKNYDFIIIDHSKTFCKLELQSNSENSKLVERKTDTICLEQKFQ